MNPKWKWKIPLVVALLFSYLSLMTACQQELPATTETLPASTNTLSPTVEPESSAISEWAPELLFRLRHEQETNLNQVSSVAFSPDGSLVAAGIFREVRLWNTHDGSQAQQIELSASVDDLDLSPDGTLLIAGQLSGGVRLVNMKDGTELYQLHSGYDNRVTFSPEGKMIATGNREGSVWLWSAEDGEQVAELKAPDAENLTALAFSPDGQTLAAGHFDCAVNLWHVDDRRLLRHLEVDGPSCYHNFLAFSSDGRLLARAGARSESTHIVRLWDVTDGAIFADLSLASEAYDVDFSPDGQLLAVGSRDGVTLWQMPDASLLYTLEHVFDTQENDKITRVAFSPNSKLLAVGRRDGILELWQVQPE